jgi:hypothetical protein
MYFLGIKFNLLVLCKYTILGSPPPHTQTDLKVIVNNKLGELYVKI